jgi:hypothetical protein
MAKANSVIARRYAWRSVIDPWVTGKAWYARSRTTRPPLLLRGFADSAFVVPQNLLAMQRQIYGRQVTTDAPSAWRERGGSL